MLRAGAWAARGLRVPARNALLADAVPASAYGHAYGYERAMDNFGAIGGPLLALGLVALVGVRTSILLSVIPGAMAALAILAAIQAIPKPTIREHQPIRVRIRPVLHGRLGRLLVGISAFEVGNAAATLLILRATELLTPEHGRDSAVKIALGLYAGDNLAATVASVPGGRMATVAATFWSWRSVSCLWDRLRRSGVCGVEHRCARPTVRSGRGRYRLRGDGRARSGCIARPGQPARVSLRSARCSAELREPGRERSCGRSVDARLAESRVSVPRRLDDSGPLLARHGTATLTSNRETWRQSSGDCSWGLRTTGSRCLLRGLLCLTHLLFRVSTCNQQVPVWVAASNLRVCRALAGRNSAIRIAISRLLLDQREQLEHREVHRKNDRGDHAADQDDHDRLDDGGQRRDGGVDFFLVEVRDLP